MPPLFVRQPDFTREVVQVAHERDDDFLRPRIGAAAECIDDGFSEVVAGQVFHGPGASWCGAEVPSAARGQYRRTSPREEDGSLSRTRHAFQPEKAASRNARHIPQMPWGKNIVTTIASAPSPTRYPSAEVRQELVQPGRRRVCQ